jgi:hypothetical protein
MKAVVRSLCAHGCVRCGVAVFEYRLLPRARVPADAPAPEDVVLLCPPCHAALAAGGADAALVEGMARAPFASLPDFDRRYRLVSRAAPDVELAGRTMSEISVPVSLAGVPIVQFTPPARDGAATEISLRLGDAQGSPRILVEHGEWMAEPGWSFAHARGRIAVRQEGGPGRFVLRILSPTLARVEGVETMVWGRRLQIDPHRVLIGGRPVIVPAVRRRIVGLAL